MSEIPLSRLVLVRLNRVANNRMSAPEETSLRVGGCGPARTCCHKAAGMRAPKPGDFAR